VIRVLVVDDDELVRSGFRMILEAQDDIEVVGEAADGADAVAMTMTLAPHVVLMDVSMAGVDGIEATRQLVANTSSASRILMVTTFDLDRHVYDAFRAGASGFLLKNVPAAQLIGAVRCVARGDMLLSPSITRRLIETFTHRPAPASGRPSQLAALTERELQVLAAVGRGRSNVEIAQELFLSEATIRTHINHVLSKLQLRDRVQAVVLAYETGLVHPGGESVSAR
jgi:DNA-binding NarL/FixJ family response regulator